MHKESKIQFLKCVVGEHRPRVLPSILAINVKGRRQICQLLFDLQKQSLKNLRHIAA